MRLHHSTPHRFVGHRPWQTNFHIKKGSAALVIELIIYDNFYLIRLAAIPLISISVIKVPATGRRQAENIYICFLDPKIKTNKQTVYLNRVHSDLKASILAPATPLDSFAGR